MASSRQPASMPPAPSSKFPQQARPDGRKTGRGAPSAPFPPAGGPAAFITHPLAVAADATHAGLLTLTAAQAYQPGMLIVAENVGANTQLDGTIATGIASGLPP